MALFIMDGLLQVFSYAFKFEYLNEFAYKFDPLDNPGWEVGMQTISNSEIVQLLQIMMKSH